MDLPHSQCHAGRKHAGRGRRHHVRFERQRMSTRSMPAAAASIWHYQRPRTKGLAGNAAIGFNRGVAVVRRPPLHADRQRPHDVAESLQRRAAVGNRDGGLASELQRHVRAAGRRQSGDLRHRGRRRRRARIRRRLRSATGKEVWRFWTVPKPGEPGSETWKGNSWSIAPAPPG